VRLRAFVDLLQRLWCCTGHFVAGGLLEIPGRRTTGKAELNSNAITPHALFFIIDCLYFQKAAAGCGCKALGTPLLRLIWV
jgi:hypothetical protein